MREELVAVAERGILTYWRSVGAEVNTRDAREVAEAVVLALAEITAPMAARRRGVIRIDPTDLSAHSFKPGNITLDLRKLLTSFATSVLTVAGAVAVPWTVPLAAIVLVDSVLSNLRVEISEIDAAIVWVMWNRQQRRNPGTLLLDDVNAELRRHGRPRVTQRVLGQSLERLERIGCVERPPQDDQSWTLKERLTVKYR
jgi:hypothetical protein